MGLAGLIIQANLNHSARAQDLLLQTMTEHDIGIAAVSEPYRVPENSNYVGDLTGTAAIFRMGSTASPALKTIVRSRSFVVPSWGGIAIVSLYASPNTPMTTFRKLLDKARDCVAPLVAQNVLIGDFFLGDFNAKSTPSQRCGVPRERIPGGRQC